LSNVGMTIIMSTHDIQGTARRLPWIVCLNKTVIAEGHPSKVLTDMNLLRTYGLMDNSSPNNDDANERTVVQ
jgi:ABC-type Mn2+/Zn2+ transport system ATPase subunit